MFFIHFKAPPTPPLLEKVATGGKSSNRCLSKARCIYISLTTTTYHPYLPLHIPFLRLGYFFIFEKKISSVFCEISKVVLLFAKTSRRTPLAHPKAAKYALHHHHGIG